MTEDDGDTVDSIVDKAVERADTGRDTFRPVSVDDRFTKRVRDDHAPNAALHAAIKAAAEDDDRIHSVNLMGSHAPGNRHKGEPRYNVRVDVRNDGMGHPVLGATVVGRLVDRGDVRITDVVECSDDHLVVAIRPVETRVEPIDVPVDDIPDDVFERDVEVDLTDLKTFAQGRDVDKGSVTVSPSEGTVERLQDAARCFEQSTHFPDTLMPAVAAWSGRRPPVAPIREWVEDREHIFDTAKDPDTIAGLIADAVAAAGEDDVLDDFPATTDEIERFRSDFDAEYEPPDVITGAMSTDDFVPYTRRRDGKPTVHVALQDKDDGSIVAEVTTKAEEWEEVDTGRGIYNVRVDVGAEAGKSAKPVTAYVCHGCDRKTLPRDFVTHEGVDGPACPRCGTAVDWDKTGGDE